MQDVHDGLFPKIRLLIMIFLIETQPVHQNQLSVFPIQSKLDLIFNHVL